jgi:hypothetical protein
MLPVIQIFPVIFCKAKHAYMSNPLSVLQAGSCNLLCFVDFSSPPEARAALETLQGNYNIIFSASICIVVMLPISLDSACAQFHSFMFVCL